MSAAAERIHSRTDIGATLTIKDPTSYLSEAANREALKALVDEKLVVVASLDAAPSAKVLADLRETLGAPPAPSGNELVLGYKPVGEYSFLSDVHVPGGVEPEPESPRALAWPEEFHYDGETLYSVSTYLEGVPYGPNRYRDMAAVYADLPADLKQLVTGGYALHGPLPKDLVPLSTCKPVTVKSPRLPLVIRHPRSGLPVLRLPRNPLSRIEGLGEGESFEVLQKLWAITERSPHAFEIEIRPLALLLWDGARVAQTNPLFQRSLNRRQWFYTVPGKTKLLPAYV